MTQSYFCNKQIVPIIPTSKSTPTLGGVSNQRLASDPYFYATITLQNVADGSEYRVSMHDSPYTELALGQQSGTGDIEISNVPAYSNPMLFDVLIRNSPSVGTKYLEFNTIGSLIKAGSIVYVVQQQDPYA